MVKRSWRKCSKCGGSGKKEHPNYEGVYIGCSKCGGSGGTMKVEDDGESGCAIAMLCILGSAMVSSCAVGYGIIKAIL